IDGGISSKLLKFADDTKVFSRVSTVEEVKTLRNDLKSLFKWSEDWLMLFNLEKCKVMRLGKANLLADYEIGGRRLEVVDEERDSGVIVQKDVKVSKQCANAVAT